MTASGRGQIHAYQRSTKIGTSAVATIEACSAGEAPASQVITVAGELITADNAADFAAGAPDGTTAAATTEA